MSATNSTTHYNLPSFLGSDKPAWLVDWNGAMATIDSAIYEAKQAADTAGTSASAVASDLATLSGTVSTQGSTISTLSETLTTAVGNINTINSLIGNGTPTTTDQTIIGAINEINARTGEADGISYDNTDSGLSATNVQSAIDEVNASLTQYNSIETVSKSSVTFTVDEIKDGYEVGDVPAISGRTLVGIINTNSSSPNVAITGAYIQNNKVYARCRSFASYQISATLEVNLLYCKTV